MSTTKYSNCCGAEPRYPKYICPVCGIEFCVKDHPERVRKFCSKRCSKMSESNPMWKGDKVGYAGIHDWVKYHLQKPSACTCCGEIKRLDLANISNAYKRDLTDWEWLCRKCHMQKDGRLIRINNYNSLRKIGDINCLTCDKLFRAKGSTTRFCSKSCAATYSNIKRHRKKLLV